MLRIVIVGAGPAGLATAFRLQHARSDFSITLLEPRSRPGGNVSTRNRDGFRVECGPNGFLDSKPGMRNLCRDLGLADRLIAASEGSRKNRFVFVKGQLQKLPSSPPGILTTPLLSLRGKWELLREPFRRRPHHLPEDESVAEFARRRFGREAADIFVDALVTGIHAGDPEQLSVAAAFPRLVQFEREAGSVLRGFLRASKLKRAEAKARGEQPQKSRMWSFREGLGLVVETLANQPGITIHTGVEVQSLERTENGWRIAGEGRDSWDAYAVVLAAPAYAQARILERLDSSLAAELASIEYNRVAVVALGYRQSDVPGSFDGFGYIAPQNTKRDVLGVQWCSSIFPDRAPPGFVLWRVLCGGSNRPDMFDHDDETLTKKCHEEMKRVMGVRGEPVFREIVRWPRAIPQYKLGHLERVQRIESRASNHPKLFLTGNSLHGIALNDVAEQATHVTQRMLAELQTCDQPV